MNISHKEVLSAMELLHLARDDRKTPVMLASHFIITESLYQHPQLPVLKRNLISYIKLVLSSIDDAVPARTEKNKPQKIVKPEAEPCTKKVDSVIPQAKTLPLPLPEKSKGSMPMTKPVMDGAQQITMSSQDIAELVEKRHDNVKRTIETLIVRGVITSPQIEEKPTAGRPATFYVFEGEKGKRDSIIVVAQLSPEFTARLVDRWQELEAKIATPTVNPLEALNDPTFLRDALLGYSEKVIALQGQVEEMKPDVITLEKLGAEGSMTITLAAKNLQISPRALFDYLQHNGWIYRENGAWQPVWVAYQTKIDAGYLLQKVGSYEKGDGRIGVREQVRVTPKGLAKLGKLLSKNEN